MGKGLQKKKTLHNPRKIMKDRSDVGGCGGSEHEWIVGHKNGMKLKLY